MKQVVTLFNVLFILSLLVACGSAAVEPEIAVTTAVAQPATQEATATVEVAQVTATAVATDLPPTATATTPPTSPPPSPTPFTMATTEEVAFTLLNQQGGTVNSVAIVGQTAFVVTGPRLLAVDITDPTNPQIVGQTEPQPSLLQTILVRDGVAYVSTQSSIAAWDVSSPQAPNLLTTLELDETIVQLAWHGETLIVATADLPVDNPQDGTARIITLDSQLQLLGSIDLPWELPWNVGSGAIALADGMLYASNTGQETFFAIDLQDPTTLPDPIPFSVAILTYSLQAHGQTLYVGGGLSNIMAWDVSDLASPQKLWEIQGAPNPDYGMGVVHEFIVDGNYAYLDTSSYHGLVFGPLVLELPEPVATEQGILLSTKMGMQNDRLIVGRANGLDFYTLPDEAGIITPYTSYELSDAAVNPSDITFVNNNHVIVSQGYDTGYLSLLELPTLQFSGHYEVVRPPLAEETETYPRLDFRQLAVTGNTAYVAFSDQGWGLFDLSDLENPTLLSTFAPPSLSTIIEVADMVIVGERLYTAVRTSSLYQPSFVVLDIAAPHDPAVVTTSAIPQYPNQAAYPRQIEANENNAYLATEHNAQEAIFTLDRFSLNGPEPLLTTRLELDGRVNAMLLYENVILLGTDDGLMVVASGAEDAPLTIMAQAEIPNGVWELAVMDGLLLATTKGNQLLAIDLQDPAQPRQIGATSLPSGNAHLAAANGTVVVGNASMGFMVFAVE